MKIKKNQKQCFNSSSVFVARFCLPLLPTIGHHSTFPTFLVMPCHALSCLVMPFIFPYFFDATTVLFVFNKKCEIDWNYNDTIPGMYRSGALISYLGATGSDLLY